jgi:hypothetical protein
MILFGPASKARMKRIENSNRFKEKYNDIANLRWAHKVLNKRA